MDQSTEQNKTEAPTPYKLKRAREKGVVARGLDLGFFAALAAFTLFVAAAGRDSAELLSQAMLWTLALIPSAEFGGIGALSGLGPALSPVVQRVALLAGTIALVVALFEIVQVGGVVVSTQPLKPDFGRLNPGKNLKRLFSLLMLKQTLKSILKMGVYGMAAYLVLRAIFETRLALTHDAHALAANVRDASLSLLFTFTIIALGFALLDQVLARGEFHSQMRMSRRELQREAKEREGEPRIKHKRRQLHAQFVKQARSIRNLKGADMLVVNPDHFAIGLIYDEATMNAPRIKAKGRNRFALILKRRAASMAIPILEAPALARALYKTECDAEIAPMHYRDAADLYLRLARLKEAPDAPA